MNNIKNKFLLTKDKFTPKMHLKQPRLTYVECWPVTKILKTHEILNIYL